MNINKETDVLLVIDVQHDFCPGGALAVIDGDEIVEGINTLSERFDTIVLSQDWHPENHSSFASNHEGKNEYEEIDMPYGKQKLWPNHCVQNTRGAEFREDLEPTTTRACSIVRKGMNPHIDSYSAFFENDRVTSTGLGGFLKERGIKRVFLTGLAYDFCVSFSALDAKNLGFEVVVVKDLTRSIGIPLENEQTTETVMDQRLNDEGVVVTDLAGALIDDQPKQGRLF